MRFTVMILLATSTFASAHATDARFASAAWLGLDGVDPGREVAAEAFQRLVDRAALETKPKTKPEVPERADLSIELDDGVLAQSNPSAAVRATVERWTRAAKHAKSRSSAVRRLMVVGPDAIREVLARRAARAEAYQSLYDEAPVGPPREPGPSRQVLVANGVVAGWALLKIGGGLAVAALQLRKGHYWRAGAVALFGTAWAAPLLKVSFDTLYVHAKQGLLNRGWIHAASEPASAWSDEYAFDQRVDGLLTADRREAFAYRGARVKVDLRRTDSKLPFKRQPVPQGEDVFARAVARKGRVPAIDRRQIEIDEVVYFDAAAGDWVMIGVAAG